MRCAVQVGQERRHLALGLQRKTDRGVEIRGRDRLQLRAALEMRRGDLAAPTFQHLGPDRDRSAHLDRGARDLAVALGIVHVADEQAAAVGEAGQEQRGADLHLLHVHVAAILARRNGAQALVLVAAVRPAHGRGQGADRLRRQHDPAHLAERLFAVEPCLDLGVAGQHPDRAHERRHRHAHARHLVRRRRLAVELPVDHVRVGEQIAQEAEARHDHRVPVLIGLDVDQRDREHIALLGALDEHRSGERVHQVEIERGDVVRGRVDGQVAVERIAGLEHDVIARLGPRHGRDRRMIAIEAVRVVGAMSAALLDHHPVLPGHVAGVGQRSGRTSPCPRAPRWHKNAAYASVPP